MMEIVEATPDLVRAWYVDRPPVTFRGFVALIDGKPEGVGGVSFVNGAPVAFAEMTDVLRARRRDIARCVRKLEQFMDRYPLVLAIPDAREPTAPALLAKLGWQPTGVDCERGPILERTPKHA